MKKKTDGVIQEIEYLVIKLQLVRGGKSCRVCHVPWQLNFVTVWCKKQ
jgi:hypothetical protein